MSSILYMKMNILKENVKMDWLSFCVDMLEFYLTFWTYKKEYLYLSKSKYPFLVAFISSNVTILGKDKKAFLKFKHVFVAIRGVARLLTWGLAKEEILLQFFLSPTFSLIFFILLPQFSSPGGRARGRPWLRHWL